MRRSILAPLIVVSAIPVALLLSTAALGQDRPRLRPTPPPATMSSPAPVETAASPTPIASPAGLPDAGGCFGLERPPAGSSPDPLASSAPPPTATPAPDDTTRHKVPAAGVRLDLPAGWVGLQDDDLASLDEIPALTEALAALEASSLVFLGVDVLPGEDCAVGADLSLYDLGSALDPRLLELSVEAIALGLEELDEVEGEVKVSSVDLPVGEAQRLTFTFDATEDGALTPWWVRADVITASGHTLLAAYAAPADAADDAKPVFNAIAKSIREL